MPKQQLNDYKEEVALQRKVWLEKKVLRIQYEKWYGMVVRALSSNKPTIEIGSGSGNFKQYYPECVATDVVLNGPWIDMIVDAQHLPFKPGDAGNFVVCDAIHHFQRPVEFLRQCAASLKPGGRIVLLEPALTWWSKIVYKTSHHEPLDMKWDPFSVDGKPPDPDPGHTFANIAIPEILFYRRRKKTLAAVPDLKLVSAHKFGFLAYPLTGGFNYRSFLPAYGFETLIAAEDLLTRPIANWMTGMRMLVVLEKVG